ncbi:uncharacterized protein BP5553_03998 [Venustampulla echinocandica]|uniref:Aminoglycoside phosphotransferase domain-containing protein n=1 Tax=Venustampulla echinocandica TaxID=2656787 RepID=A0A370TW07_9HELO|nr:uncharacterized protein BP5553_03998 [Venustampulla echinocandica]RDL39658.1 hypothetical protein BP5553_03998 [Venustampulla echinocandica]
MPLHSQSSRFWTCSIADCSKPAVIDTGHCERCQSHFCVQHRESAQHTCKQEPLDDAAWDEAQTKELESLRGNVNDNQLLELASRLRGGIGCAFDSSDHLGRSRMGGMHIHLRIVFVDGTVWLARIPRVNSTSFADHLRNQILESECATLKWLEKVRITAPRLHHYGRQNDELNRVGVAYMLIDELPGKPLTQLQPSEQENRGVYAGLAEILSTLSSHPFEQIGSLAFDSHGSIHVGTVAGDRTGTLSPIGPFSGATQYYSKWAEEYLRLISDHQLFTNYPVNAYLIFRYLHNLAIEGKFNVIDSSLDLGPFYLKHMDDKGDHILVDDKFNITGIIDWSFARIVPAYEAFGPSLVTAEMSDIYDGNALRANGSHLTRFADSTGRVRRLTFGMNMTWAEALLLFKGIITESCGSTDDFEWETWRRDRLVEWADDGRLLDDEAWGKTITDEITGLLAKINVQALREVATSLNTGKGCTFTPGQYIGSGAIMGCANYHAWLTFNDGEKWIVRIPRVPFSDIPSKLIEYLVASEYATLKFLEITKIPAAKVFGYGLASDPNNLVGVSYLFMEAIPGTPYQALDANPEQREHVLSQVADILIEISKHPFQTSGSLLLDDGKLVMSDVASDRFVSLGQYGPYDTALDYFTSIAEQHLDIIADGQEYFEYPKEAYLFYRILRDQAAAKLAARQKSNTFYLKHVDDKGDHILIDENYNITGIIDWQFTRTVPACEAFGPSLITANLNNLCSKDWGLMDDDMFLARQLETKGSADLASYMGADELARRFMMFGLASGLYHNEVWGFLKGF